MVTLGWSKATTKKGNEEAPRELGMFCFWVSVSFYENVTEL